MEGRKTTKKNKKGANDECNRAGVLRECFAIQGHFMLNYTSAQNREQRTYATHAYIHCCA
jgi:uncharacterized protein Veg